MMGRARREGKICNQSGGKIRRNWLRESHRADRRYGKALIRAALDGTDAPRAEPARVAADWWGFY